MSPNGNGHAPPASAADEVSDLLDAVQSLIIPFIRSVDPTPPFSTNQKGRTALIDPQTPQSLQNLLDLDLPRDGAGKDGLLEIVGKVLRYSVNTWDQGFMDKLYSSTNAVGVVSELILAVLNTNVHVYQVSPTLTLIEKHVTTRLARLFGFTSPHAGGISQPGGSASNSSSIVIARNTLFPETKVSGLGSRRFSLFTSEHGHYSLEKAAQILGLGSDGVRSVPVNGAGRMKVGDLERMVLESKERGETPFYVNATAGTTVLGSFDPLDEIADVCQRHGLWMHVDGSWGGSVVFNEEIAKERLRGVERADSVAVNPHKMLGVPLTCSFLLGKDMRQFWKAMTLPAGYLFHNDMTENPSEMYDLGDLTPQCGRRGDALKLHLASVYYGTSGLSTRISTAYARADQLLSLLEGHLDFVLVSTRPLPCLQVCFYYAPGGRLGDAEVNGRRTSEVARRLVGRGWMVDFAPGEKGRFFRVVVNWATEEGTVGRLVEAIEEVGREVVLEE